MSGDDPTLVDRMLAFVRRIGIPVSVAAVETSVLPGVTIVNGGLVVDRARLTWPGDLLHDAGHIAVTDPALRPTLNEVADDPAEEMAAMAWSYAAARALEIDPAIVFHPAGYRGSSEGVLAAYAAGGTLGQPMLRYWGMTSDERFAEADGRAPFPAMHRWLR